MNVYVGTDILKNAYIGEVWTPGSNTFGYYTFDDQNSSQITDFSGKGNNLTGGTIPSYTLVSGTNYAGNFSNGGVAPSKDASGISFGNHTILAWVKPITTGNEYITMIRNSSADAQISIIYGYNSGQIEIYGGVGTTITRATIKSGVTTGTWYLIGYTREGTSVKTYCNGVAGGTTTMDYNTSTNAFYIGGNHNSARRFLGQIGECIVENKILTQAEIQKYYNQTKSDYGL